MRTSKSVVIGIGTYGCGSDNCVGHIAVPDVVVDTGDSYRLWNIPVEWCERQTHWINRAFVRVG